MSALLRVAAHSHPTWSDFSPTVWVAVVVASALAMWSVWKAVMYTLRPGEEEPDHIKRQILVEPAGLDASLSSEPAAAVRSRSGAADEVRDR